jgi:hypothetical protein
MSTTELDTPTTDTAALVRRESSGAMSLALLSDQDFDQRLQLLRRGQDRIRRIQREIMVPDEDFGIIPGTLKPTLLKPGAEKICQVYNLVPTFEERTIEGDGVTTPHLRIRQICNLHLQSSDGPIVGEGVGAANSWEKKHRYRGGQRVCPKCHVEGSIKRSKFEDRKTGDKGWYCHDKAGGCGGQFRSDDPAIIEQQAGQVENPDPFDVENTLLKMATKRAHVDAVLRTTATSGLFSQDLEDMGPPDEAPRSATKAAPPAAEPRRASNGGNGHAKPADAASTTAGEVRGKVKTVSENPDGGYLVKLNTGFVGTVADMADAGELQKFIGTDHLVILNHTQGAVTAFRIAD